MAMNIEPLVARKIKLIGIDVDGVLTDGRQLIGAVDGKRVEFRSFHIADIIGSFMLAGAGIDQVIVTGRVTDTTSMRAAELRIQDVIEAPGGDKLPPFEAYLEERSIRWEECAFIGDDLPDIPVLSRVALPIAVPNAIPEVLDIAVGITERAGGDGALREVAESLLDARGEWDETVGRYLSERGQPNVRKSSSNMRSL